MDEGDSRIRASFSFRELLWKPGGGLFTGGPAGCVKVGSGTGI